MFKGVTALLLSTMPIWKKPFYTLKWPKVWILNSLSVSGCGHFVMQRCLLSFKLQITAFKWGNIHFCSTSDSRFLCHQSLNFDFSCDFHTKIHLFSYLQIWWCVTLEPLVIQKHYVPHFQVFGRWRTRDVGALQNGHTSMKIGVLPWNKQSCHI